MKRCSGCKEEKDEADFCLNRARKDGRANECKVCSKSRRVGRRAYRSIYDAERYAALREEIKRQRKDYNEKNAYKYRLYWIKKRYGLSEEDYDRMLIDQNYKCAIEGCRVTAFSETLRVDHDHACCPGDKSCGKCIRGLLCNSCNKVLGMLKDSRRMISGLDKYLAVEV